MNVRITIECTMNPDANVDAVGERLYNILVEDDVAFPEMLTVDGWTAVTDD